MKNKQIIGLVVAGAVFIVTGVTSVLTNTLSANTMAEDVTTMLAGELEFDPPADDYIGVVNVVGTIQEQTQSSVLDTSSGYQHNTTMDYIDNLMDDSDNKGILLYVDSPGGAVYESEELHDKLVEYNETTGRPIWTYMAHYAASGGYMTSVTGDKIYANKNTVTGSIGVIMSGYDMSGLYEKLGIRYVSITSGVNKDSSKLTDEQVERLNRIGMYWGNRNDRQWNEGYQEAKRYFDAHGDLNIPAEYVSPNGYNLGNWVKRQRYTRHNPEKSCAVLTEERIAKLDTIGMRWEKSNPKRSSRQAVQAETVTAKAG